MSDSEDVRRREVDALDRFDRSPVASDDARYAHLMRHDEIVAKVAATCAVGLIPLAGGSQAQVPRLAVEMARGILAEVKRTSQAEIDKVAHEAQRVEAQRVSDATAAEQHEAADARREADARSRESADVVTQRDADATARQRAATRRS